MECQKCGATISSWNKHCLSCGAENPDFIPPKTSGKTSRTKLPEGFSACKHCDALVADDERFCPKCDTKNQNYVAPVNRPTSHTKAEKKTYEPRYTAYGFMLACALVTGIATFFGFILAMESRSIESQMYLKSIVLPGIALTVGILIKANIDVEKANQEAQFMNDMHDHMEKILKAQSDKE